MSSNFLKSTKIFFLILFKSIQRNIYPILFIFISIALFSFLQYKFDLINLNANIIRQGFIGTYQYHDLPIEVTKLISEGLVESDENNRIVAKLASGWETNNDATIFKFKLRDNLKWSDGTPIKSQDLEFPIPNTEVTFPDDKTIQFKLKEPYSPFPSLLTKPIFKKGTLIGTGPYSVVEIDKSRIFITKISLEPMQKNLPTIAIRFYPNEKTAITGFKLGEIQTLSGVGSNDLFDNFLVKTYQKTDYNKIVTIFYNTKDSALSNRSLRQALSFSSPQIKNVVEANNPLPKFSWAFEQGAKDYIDNLDEAKLAIERAKNSSSEEILQKEIILTTTPQLEEIANEIVSNWKGLGINAVVRVESGIPQNFQALLIVQTIPVDPDQYFLWHATQVQTNLTKYDSKRADKDLEDGRKLIKEEDRIASYLDFQKALLEDSPATFLYFPKYNVLYLKKAEDKLKKVLPLELPFLVRD